MLNLEWRLSRDGDAIREGHADRTVAGDYLLRDVTLCEPGVTPVVTPKPKNPPAAASQIVTEMFADFIFGSGGLPYFRNRVRKLSPGRAKSVETTLSYTDNIKARLIVLDRLVHNLTRGRPCSGQCRASAERCNSQTSKDRSKLIVRTGLIIEADILSQRRRKQVAAESVPVCSERCRCSSFGEEA